MARPKAELGCVELSLELHLEAPGSSLLGLLACYAQVRRAIGLDRPLDRPLDHHLLDRPLDRR